MTEQDHQDKKEFRNILVLGLDGAGKSTLIRYLITGRFVDKLSRTQGMEVTPFLLGDKEIPVRFYDLGGLRVFQVTLWQSMIESEITAVIYVVDSSAFSRRDDDLTAFNLVFDSVKDTPILLLANKLDLTDEESTGQLALSLDLVDVWLRQPNREISLIPMSVKTGENIEHAVEWVRRVVYNSLKEEK